MKKIYAQKKIMYFLIFFASLFFIASILGSIFVDLEYLFMLMGACLFLAIIPLSLYNKIYYDDEKIKFWFVKRKLEVTYNDIKEVCLKKDFVLGYSVIFNFSQTIDEEFENFYKYGMICSENGFDTLYCTCLSRKDILKLLKNYKGKILI